MNQNPHDPSDTDRDRLAGHHTLGDKPWQAAPGNHVHGDAGISEAEATALIDAALTPYITEVDADAAYADIAHDHAGVYANASHNHFVGDLSNATALTKSFLQEATAAGARGIIGAGTSDLVLGTTAGTAAEGNHTHPADDGWTTLVKTADQTNSTVTLADVTDLDTGVIAAGLYTIEAYLLVRTAATTTGIQVGMAYPAEVVGAFNIDVPNSATAAILRRGRLTGEKASGTGIGVANQSYLARITGLFRITGTMSAGLRVQFNSEVAASNAIVKADSILRYKKVA